MSTLFKASSISARYQKIADEKDEIEPHPTDLYRKENIAVALGYFSVGFVGSFLTTPLNIYLVNVLDAEPSMQNTIGILQTLPWSLKLIFGFLSDAVPIGGMHRKPYLTFGALVYSGAYLLYATANYHNVVFLAVVVFAATLGLVQMDVMADTMCCERSKFEPEESKGQMQASCYSIRFAGGLLGALAGTIVCEKSWGLGLSFPQVALICGLVPFFLVVPWLYSLKEKYRRPKTRATKSMHQSETPPSSSKTSAALQIGGEDSHFVSKRIHANNSNSKKTPRDSTVAIEMPTIISVADDHHQPRYLGHVHSRDVHLVKKSTSSSKLLDHLHLGQAASPPESSIAPPSHHRHSEENSTDVVLSGLVCHTTTSSPSPGMTTPLCDGDDGSDVETNIRAFQASSQGSPGINTFECTQEERDVLTIGEEADESKSTATISEQLHEIWQTVQLQAVWRPMAFVYIYNIMQIPNVAWQSFLQLGLHFQPWVLGLTVTLGSFMTLAGVLAYKYFFFNASWRSIYVWSTVLTAFFSLLQLALIFQWNVKYLHMGNYLFSMGDDVISAYISGIQFLPMCIMYMRLCPDGAEGTSYSMLTTFGNVALVCASSIGNSLTGVWDVSNGAMRRHDVNGLWRLSLLTSTLALTPLFLLHLLPTDADEQDRLAKSSSRSTIGGAVFLAVLFASLTWTIYSAVAELSAA